MRVVSMNGIQQRCQTSKGTHCLMFFTTWTCTMSRLRPIPMIWYHYFRYENKGGGVKRVKKMLMKYQPKNIHLLYIDIRSIIVILL